MEVLNESSQIKQLNETLLTVMDSLPLDVEQSVYYNKLKQLLHSEIFNFCKDQNELKQDLNMLRLSIGLPMTEAEIREYLDGLKLKYNNGGNQNIAIEYDLTITKFDYAVPVFVVIRRGEFLIKKFVFRFKRQNISQGVANTTIAGIPLDILKRKDD